MEPYQKKFLSLVPKPLVLMKLSGHFPEHVISAYRYIYADSLRTVWYVTAWIAAAGFLVSFLVKNESMDRGQQSKQAFNNQHKEKKADEV
jgi:hypothetical protein